MNSNVILEILRTAQQRTAAVVLASKMGGKAIPYLGAAITIAQLTGFFYTWATGRELTDDLREKIRALLSDTTTPLNDKAVATIETVELTTVVKAVAAQTPEPMRSIELYRQIITPQVVVPTSIGAEFVGPPAESAPAANAQPQTASDDIFVIQVRRDSYDDEDKLESKIRRAAGRLGMRPDSIIALADVVACLLKANEQLRERMDQKFLGD